MEKINIAGKEDKELKEKYHLMLKEVYNELQNYTPDEQREFLDEIHNKLSMDYELKKQEALRQADFYLKQRESFLSKSNKDPFHN